MGLPEKQGLYDPRNEHDACSVGFVANIKGAKSHAIIRQGLEILLNLDHRGAVGADPLVGDGAGCLIQIPDALFRAWAERERLSLPAPGDYGVTQVGDETDTSPYPDPRPATGITTASYIANMARLIGALEERR